MNSSTRVPRRSRSSRCLWVIRVMAHVARIRLKRVDSPQRRRWAAKPDITTFLACVAFLGGGAGDARAQESPSDIAQAFYDAIASHDWDAAAATLHPEALDLFGYRLASMLQADASGRLAVLIFGSTDGAAVGERSASSVLAVLLRAIEVDAPGLIAILATNRYDPIGQIAEGADLSHVVFRVTPYTNGSAPTRTGLVTLKRREDSGWGIVESGELDAIAMAMTGLSLTAKASSGPGGP